MSEGGRACVFFDRDGVVNRSPGLGYVLSPDEFALNEGIAEALHIVSDRGALAILVTSQKCVGKGLITHEELDLIHGHMCQLLAKEGAAFDAIYCHTGEGGSEDHPAKPDPGMIFAAVERFGIDPRLSWMIGDADRDIAMGDAAGLAGTIRILSEKPVEVPATHTLSNTMEIAELLCSLL